MISNYNAWGSGFDFLDLNNNTDEDNEFSEVDLDDYNTMNTVVFTDDNNEDGYTDEVVAIVDNDGDGYIDEVIGVVDLDGDGIVDDCYVDIDVDYDGYTDISYGIDDIM